MGYQTWRKIHALNLVLYVFVTLHGLLMGTDFQGTWLAVINIVPFIILGIMLLKDKQKLSPMH
ncbi:hypothetical protein [Neobacillus mesonae]|uniref:hypothetical protein n=1 Tax=Neobacillus mesonae TaxID=1193713 RepID=UPI002E1F4E3E|nr:hypothetical protein [Neobacillus mesonae]